MLYEDMTDEQKRKHDEFCLLIVQAFGGIKSAVDATSAAFNETNKLLKRDNLEV